MILYSNIQGNNHLIPIITSQSSAPREFAIFLCFLSLLFTISSNLYYFTLILAKNFFYLQAIFDVEAD